MATDLLTFEDARARLLAGVSILPPERTPLPFAAGRVLSVDLVTPHPLPRFDHSAMDGYAIATSDLEGQGPFRLEVVGESSAGAAAPGQKPGTACRIFTGAPLPEGADAVVMQENVRREASTIVFSERCPAGQHVRRAGEDLARGAVAVPARTRLHAGALALAAMLGTTELVVARRPRVTILCTGDELVMPGQAERPGAIFESNSAALAALATQAGAAVRVAPIARDEPAETRRAIEQALDGTDVLLTVGGVSVGDRDVVRSALHDAGVTLDFYRVAIKPGKPLAFGRRAAASVLGLPGNPASALVTFALFGLPLLRAMQGDRRPLALTLRCTFRSPRRRSRDRLELVRADLRAEDGGLVAHPHDNQSSGTATSLAHSDGLAFVPPGEEVLPAGTAVDFVRWADV